MTSPLNFLHMFMITYKKRRTVNLKTFLPKKIDMKKTFVPCNARFVDNYLLFTLLRLSEDPLFHKIPC